MESRGPWSAAEVAAFLEATRIPIRLACNGASGHPVVASLWFLPREGRLWCATQKSSRIASLLARDGRCAFEVAPDAPPYRGVRGQGVATLHEARAGEILERLIDRYLDDASSPLAQFLLGRVDGETAIGIDPGTVVSWDYRKRMGGGTAGSP